MKRARFALLLSTALIAASPAYASVVTILQFGSYQTRAEAEKRLAEVSEKFKTQLGGLTLSVREVKLPTAELTVYRTQTGPIENPANAQGICAQFAALREECYVVQSAAPEASDTQAAVAQAIPVPEVATSKVEPAAESEPKKPDLTKRLSLVQEEEPVAKPPIAEDSQKNVAAATSSEPAAGTPPTPVPTPDAAAQVKSANEALDAAANAQESAAASVAGTANSGESAQHSFWYHLNPANWWADEESAPEAEIVKTSAPEPLGAEIVQNSEEVMPPAELSPVANSGAAAEVEITAPEVEGKALPPQVPLQPPVSMNPRSTDGMLSTWVQIGPFANDSAAQAFWAQYRQENPDFPVLRVRTISNLQQQLNGIMRTWLRVGPVTGNRLSDALCKSLAEEAKPGKPEKPKVSCSTVVDMGIDASRDQPAGGSRYGR